MSEPWNLEWEDVQSTEAGLPDSTGLVQRAKIPGGWLVRHSGGNAVKDGNGCMQDSQGWGIYQWSICFVPEALP